MTAIQWLFRWFMDNPEATSKEANEAFEQALQMEKEQHEYTAINIAEFVLDKIDGESNLSAKEAFEQYYEQTYGGNK